MLEDTKKFVNRFRFKGDKPVNGLGYEMEELFHDRTKQFFSHSGIEVSESLTPAISKVLNAVAANAYADKILGDKTSRRVK